MSDEFRDQATKPPTIRAWLNRCLPRVFVFRPKSKYAIYCFAGYIVGVMGYLFWNAYHDGRVWQTLDKASAVGTCVFGIVIGGVEWIREGSSRRLGIVALVTAVSFVALLMITHDVRRHLILLLLFSIAVAVLDLVRYYEVLEKPRSPRYKLTSRKLLLFGIDLPLCIGLYMLLMFWVLIEISGARVSESVVEAFLTGGLALELALTSAATTLLVTFAKD